MNEHPVSKVRSMYVLPATKMKELVNGCVFGALRAKIWMNLGQRGNLFTRDTSCMLIKPLMKRAFVVQDVRPGRGPECITHRFPWLLKLEVRRNSHPNAFANDPSTKWTDMLAGHFCSKSCRCKKGQRECLQSHR